MAVMLGSVEANLRPGRRLEVYALDDGIQPQDAGKVRASVGDRVAIHWLKAEKEKLAGLPVWGRISATTYLKLTLGEWLPPHVERALWLDCDLLVTADIATLWEMSMEGLPALAAQDQRVPLVSSRFGVQGYAELGLDPAAMYFNAGVMLIDVDGWRKLEVAARALDYLKQYRDKVYFWDQEALNAVLAGRWGLLDGRWNWHPSLSHLRKVEQREPWILHFSGNLKPWECEGSSMHYGLYRFYLDQTAWSGWRPVSNWQGRMARMYEQSLLRRWIYPLEQAGTRILRAMTKRYSA